jgi:hypothetical protein
MAKDPTTFGLKPEKLGKLLNICSDPDKSKKNEINIDVNQQRAELLQDRLAETLLTGSLKKSPLRKELTQLCRMSGLAAGESIRNLLCNNNTDIELLRKVKEHSKGLAHNTSETTEHDAGNAIYFAAIACALIYHNKRISKFSYEHLANSFNTFSKMEWVSSDLCDLFEKACKYCQNEMKE